MNKEDSGADLADDEDEGTALPQIEEETAESISEVDEEQAEVEHEDITLIDKLQLLQENTKPINPYLKLDERRHAIYEQLKEKFKAAPKTMLQKAEDKKSRIERQLETNDSKLRELLSFGDELVTNIKVANEKREVTRRDFETEQRRKLEADLKKESIESLARFDDITARWSELDTYREPMVLFEKLEEQKERVAHVMQSKDDIIKQCQEEINRINEKYYADQQKQATDVYCLVERIDNQIELMKSAYNSHMEMLQQTIEDERLNIKLNASHKWQDFYTKMSENETLKFEIARQKEQFYGEQIARISAKQEDITRATRIRLEKDAELLEWELHNVKNSVLMNSEKLDYNYQVLQKRNEENAIINNQQKRRVAKLNESISVLKKKLEASKKKSNQSVRKLTADIEKLHASITELEKKAAQFQRNNKLKFDKVWAINFKDIQNSLEKVFEIDRILYEQQLVMPWCRPEVDMRDINVNEKDKEHTSPYCMEKKSNAKKSTTPTTSHNSAQHELVEIRFLRNIIRKIADRAGFLLEDKLFKILEPYTEEEKCVVRIDNIFAALRIQDLKSVNSLTKYFEPYSWCPHCSKGVSKEALRSMYTVAEELKITTNTVARNTLADLQVHPRFSMKPKADDKKICENHVLVMEPALVLTALNDFTAKQWGKRRYSVLNVLSISKDPVQINLINFENQTIEKFWRKFSGYIPQEKRKLWEVLQHGLNHYLEVLKQREQLDRECSFLRRQNQELRHLLIKFKL